MSEQNKCFVALVASISRPNPAATSLRCGYSTVHRMLPAKSRCSSFCALVLLLLTLTVGTVTTGFAQAPGQDSRGMVTANVVNALAATDKMIPAFYIPAGDITVSFGLISPAKKFVVNALDDATFNYLLSARYSYDSHIQLSNPKGAASLIEGERTLRLGSLLSSGRPREFNKKTKDPVSVVVPESVTSASSANYMLISLLEGKAVKAAVLVSRKSIEPRSGKDLFYAVRQFAIPVTAVERLRVLEAATKTFQALKKFTNFRRGKPLPGTFAKLASAAAFWGVVANNVKEKEPGLANMSATYVQYLQGCAAQMITQPRPDNKTPACVLYLREMYARLYHSLGEVEANEPLVKVYSYKPSETDYHRVIFKYADLLNRATRHKLDNPDDIVEVRFALYKISKELYVGVDPEDDDYGKVNGESFGAQHLTGQASANPLVSERLVDSVLKASRANVDVRFVYHNPHEEGLLESITVEGYLRQELGAELLDRARRVNWGKPASHQMHNKFIAVRILRRNKSNVYLPISHAVYTSSSNGDPFTDEYSPLPTIDLAQSGALVRGHSALHSAYAKYFDVIWSNYDNLGRFRSSIRSLHDTDSLNYQDTRVQAYFYPIPIRKPPSQIEPELQSDDYSSGWVERFNPVTALVNKLYYTSGPRHIKIKSYYCGTSAASGDAFSARLSSELEHLRTIQVSGSTLDIRSVIHKLQPDCQLSNFDYQLSGNEAPTHEKNIQFAFGRDKLFYSITGSTNISQSEFTAKANNSLVIVETTSEHPIYGAFKEVFYGGTPVPSYYPIQ